MHRASLDSIWRVYGDIFRKDAHQLLAWGAEDARENLKPGQEETEITGYIAEAINNRLSSYDTAERFNRYCLKEDDPIPGENRSGKRRRRLDIVVECNFFRPRPLYIFESKRLCKRSHPIMNYIGEDGLQRFIRGIYAPQSSEVAMIAYIQSDSPGYWQKKLLQEFKGRSKKSLKLKKMLTKKEVIPSLPYEWVSEHKRVRKAAITVYHIFLVCMG